MQYLQKWTQGKPPVLVILVHTLVHEFEDTQQTLSQIRIGKSLGFDISIPPKLWRKFYWRNNRVLKHIKALQAISLNPDDSDHSVVEISQDDIENYIQSETGETQNLREILGQVVFNLVQSDQPQDRHKAYVTLAALTFAWRVWFPCWLHYQNTPFGLYLAARGGDDQALDQLLRVDKSAVTIPEIGRRWHEIMTGGNAKRRDFMLKAITGTPGRPLHPARFKISICAMIQILAEAMHEPLATAEVRRLLDAIEKDRLDDENAIDTTIPDDDESFARSLRRERQSWMSFLPSKKSDEKS